jgi:peptidoglycan/xylan/chitin deacetylase (PgdA/CDA1 family)
MEMIKLINKAVNQMDSRLCRAITGVIVEEPIVALTFDDGPDPESTPLFLHVLERYKAKATFFVVGERAAEYPELIKIIVKNGHEVGNHSWDHTSFTKMNWFQQVKQLQKCQRLLDSNGTRLLRPPFGHQNAQSSLVASILGYRVIGWSATADDWYGCSADAIIKNLQDVVTPGRIVLFHDSVLFPEHEEHKNRKAVLEALLHLLSLNRHYRFVTVSELLSRGRSVRHFWKILPNKV